MSTKGIVPDNLLDDNNIETRKCTQGICMEMCPPEEVTLRTKEKLVHVLEVTTSGHKLVKSYCRSAADSNMVVPRLLRPFPVLSDTVHYLLLEVPKRKDVKKLSVKYDFLNDRLRAVRQDMTIQRLLPEQCVVLLEPMIRFYVYYGYRLSDHPSNEFVPVLNKKDLLQCMKWFLNCCDVLHKPEEGDDIDSIIDSLNSLDICKVRPELSCDRILIESLYIICNLNDIHPLYRYLRLPKYVKRAPALKLAYDIAIANKNGNYIRTLRLAKRLCPLTYAALCLSLPTIQRRALQVMSHGYSSKNLTVPVEVLKDWLWFNSCEEVRATCAHYELQVLQEKHGVCFNKTSFIESQQVIILS
nr:germinal-center associated nuclear protein [Maniola hyperantus]